MTRWIVALLLLASPAQAADYYVATTGSGSSCTFGTPCASFATAFGLAGASDTIHIRAGTYTEVISTGTFTITGGSSEGTRLTVKAYNNEEVILRPTSGAIILRLEASLASWITFDDLIFDGGGLTYPAQAIKIHYSGAPTNSSNHIRIEDSEVRNVPGHGILVTGELLTGASATNNHFLRLFVHDNGAVAQYDHGIYIASDDNIVEDCEITRNAAFGVHVYCGDCTSDRNQILNNRIYNNALLGQGAAVLVGTGSDNVVTGNKLYNDRNGVLIWSCGLTYCPLGPFNAIDTIVTGNCVWSQLIDTIAEGGDGTPSGSVMTPNTLAPCPEMRGATLTGGSLQ
jgi:hypothetical protein